MFPKIAVPPNHPFWHGFPLHTIHFGVSLFLETPIWIPNISNERLFEDLEVHQSQVRRSSPECHMDFRNNPFCIKADKKPWIDRIHLKLQGGPLLVINCTPYKCPYKLLTGLFHPEISGRIWAPTYRPGDFGPRICTKILFGLQVNHLRTNQFLRKMPGLEVPRPGEKRGVFCLLRFKRRSKKFGTLCGEASVGWIFVWLRIEDALRT